MIQLKLEEALMERERRLSTDKQSCEQMLEEVLLSETVNMETIDRLQNLETQRATTDRLRAKAFSRASDQSST